jgi:hypothetical protein
MCVHFRYGLYVINTRSFSWKLASRFSVLAVAFHMHHVFSLYRADLPTLKIPRLPLHIHQQVALAFSVTPSFTYQVQESLPVIHRLRLSASP